MAAYVRWSLGIAVAVVVGVVPVVSYRHGYNTSKRLREVTPGRVYRSGQMTEEGFADSVRRLKIRTVLNLQDDFPDPDIRRSWPIGSSCKESVMCRELGVRYAFIGPDLVFRKEVPQRRPEAIERFLEVMDDPESYPVLIHCKAGLHRTGVMVAIYRMEYEGWTREAAMQEVLDNGFGRHAGTEANDYIKQYVLTYQPGFRQPEARAAQFLRDRPRP